MTIDWKNATEVLEDILQKLDLPEGREFAQTFSSPILAWGAGMAVGVAKAIEEMQPILDAKQAEIDAIKAQNAELLAALTESLAYVEATLSNHDAGCQRHPSTEHAHDCILSDLDQIKTAIAKARGDL